MGRCDFSGRLLTINGGSAINGNTRHLPLNADAATTLRSWRAQSKDLNKVFPVTTSFNTAWGSILTKAKITKLRWHDLRHHFAGRLVQGGVPLNTVRDLLGHGSLAMTLRYAHLAPDQKREAVEMLIARSGAREQREQPA
jgi:integrase